MSEISPSEFEATFYEQLKNGGVSLNHLYMIAADTHVMLASWEENDKPGYLKRINAIYSTNDAGNIIKVIDYYQSIVPDTVDWIAHTGQC